MTRAIAIKESVDRCDWAEAVYGCDAAWWRHRKGLPEFAGLKIAWAGNGLQGYPDIRRIEIAKAGRAYSSSIIVSPAGTIGSGGNSGFQAMNIAIQFGARRIILVGIDLTDAGGMHWYGRNGWLDAGNPSDHAFRGWRRAFEDSAVSLEAMGIEVINASPVSAIGCFPKMGIGEALERWRP